MPMALPNSFLSLRKALSWIFREVMLALDRAEIENLPLELHFAVSALRVQLLATRNFLHRTGHF
jgi:hypothetical protein